MTQQDVQGVALRTAEQPLSTRAEAAVLGISKSEVHRRRQAEELKRLRALVAEVQARPSMQTRIPSAAQPTQARRPAFGFGRPFGAPKPAAAAVPVVARETEPVREPEPVVTEIPEPVAAPLPVARSEGRRRLVGREVSDVTRRVLVIGDTHCKPDLLHRVRRVMAMIGLAAAVIAPDDVVHIGDGNDNESVCPHVPDNTIRGRRKPSFRKDMAAFSDAWDVLNRTLDAGGVTKKRHYCYGNHDVWVAEHEDSDPALEGILTGEYEAIFRNRGWTTSAYGEKYYLGGVAYTHAVLSKKAQAISGLDTEKMVGRDADSDTVIGHTHQTADVSRENRHGRKLRIVNAGSSMPQDHVPEWAEHTLAAEIDYGIRVVVDRAGRITNSRWISMAELEERYGAEADRILAEGGVR